MDVQVNTSSATPGEPPGTTVVKVHHITADPNLWRSDFGPSLLMAAGYTLCSIPGVLGNLLVILSILTNSTLRTVANMFIVYLALADLSITGLVQPFSLLPLIIQGNIFFDDPVLCLVFGIICSVACCASPITIAFIGFNRYICVCHNQYYSTVFSYKGSALVFSLLVLYSWLPIIVVPTGFGKIEYDPKSLLCTASRVHDINYIVYLAATNVVIPIILVVIFYSGIFYSVHKSKKTLRKFMEGDKSGTGNTRINQAHLEQEIRLARTLLAVVSVLLICMTPWACLLVFDYSNRYPKIAYHIIALLYHLNSTINPILYGVTNKRFRQGYFDFLRKVFPCVNWTKEVACKSNKSADSSVNTRATSLATKIDTGNGAG